VGRYLPATKVTCSNGHFHDLDLFVLASFMGPQSDWNKSRQSMAVSSLEANLANGEGNIVFLLDPVSVCHKVQILLFVNAGVLPCCGGRLLRWPQSGGLLPAPTLTGQWVPRIETCSKLVIRLSHPARSHPDAPIRFFFKTSEIRCGLEDWFTLFGQTPLLDAACCDPHGGGLVRSGVRWSECTVYPHRFVVNGRPLTSNRSPKSLCAHNIKARRLSVERLIAGF